MYCLTFQEGDLKRNFYYHNYKNALKLQRDLLIVEINKLVTEETGEAQFKFDEVNCLMNQETGASKMSNYDLQRLLNVLIELAYKDDSFQFRINVDIEEIICEDIQVIDN